MKKNLLNLLLLFVSLLGLQAAAAIPNGYYTTALGKSDQELMTALHKKIHGHYMIYYGNLWEKFKTTDCNGNIIIDRYSNTQFIYSTNQCSSGGYSGVGDCYNREHSVPNSWWGADEDTMYTDLYHMYPVDGYVNNMRANHPFGDCNNGTTYGTGKLGRCTHSGYSGTVFEVADEYKGDFARTYFYMVVRYMDRVGSWTLSEGNAVFTNSSYKHLTTWAISQLLEWHRNDPVSALETTRNDAVYGIQHNRNPFIDHPELAEFLWGNQTGNAWTGSATNTPTISSPANGSTINVGTNTGNGVSKTITVKGVYLTQNVTVSVTGTGFSVTPSTLTAAAVNAGTTVTVTYNGAAANSTGRLSISSNEVSNSSTLTATYNTGGGGSGTETIETWEGCSVYESYGTTFIQGHAFAWNTSDVGIWASDTHKNGELSCRFGKTAASYIEMAEDLSDGASKVSFYAQKWSSNEATPTLQLQYSTDAGSTWTNVGSCTPNNTWQQYIFNLNVTGNVRIKILQTAGARLNIDDIAITSNPTAVAVPELTSPVDGSTVHVGTITGDETQVTKAIVVKGSNLTKTLVLTASGDGFSVTPRMISASSANAGATATITYSAAQAGDVTGTLVISSNEVNVTVNLTAGKVAMPTIQISPLDRIEAVRNGESGIVTGIVSADNNEENITLTVGSAFELSLNQVNWANTLTLDPSGEVFYVRLASTNNLGAFISTITASTSQITVEADVEGVVNPLLGDVNMDGYLNVADVTALIAYILGTPVSPFNVEVANVNGDASINVADVTNLIAIILGTSSSANLMSWNAVPGHNGIVVNNLAGEYLEVFDMEANCVATTRSIGTSTLNLPAGIYFVTSDTESRKVVIK